MLALLFGCAPRLPTATLDEVVLTEVGWDDARAEVRVAVDNPLWAEVPTGALRCTLALGGRPLASGSLAAAPPLAADAVTIVPIPLVVAWSDLAAAATTEADPVTWRFAAELDVATPAGTFTLPVSHEGTIPR